MLCPRKLGIGPSAQFKGPPVDIGSTQRTSLVLPANISPHDALKACKPVLVVKAMTPEMPLVSAYHGVPKHENWLVVFRCTGNHRRGWNIMQQ